jgi:hypothetical protein
MESESHIMRDTRFYGLKTDLTILRANSDLMNTSAGASIDRKVARLTITGLRHVDLGIISRKYKNVEAFRLVDTTVLGMDVSTWIHRRKLLVVESTRWDILYMLAHRLSGYCQCEMSDVDNRLPYMTLRWVFNKVPAQEFAVPADPAEGGACNADDA